MRRVLVVAVLVLGLTALAIYGGAAVDGPDGDDARPATPEEACRPRRARIAEEGLQTTAPRSPVLRARAVQLGLRDRRGSGGREVTAEVVAPEGEPTTHVTELSGTRWAYVTFRTDVVGVHRVDWFDGDGVAVACDAFVVVAR